MEDTFKIKSYGFGELVQLYLPDIQAKSATKRLRAWIKLNNKLSVELELNGYNHKNKLLTPHMVSLIIKYLGEP